MLATGQGEQGACIGSLAAQSRSARPVRSRKTSSSVARRIAEVLRLDAARLGRASSSAPIVAATSLVYSRTASSSCLTDATAGSAASSASSSAVDRVEPDRALLEALRDQLVDRAHLEDVAVVHDRQAVAQDLGLLHVVGRQQHRPALAP